MAESETTLLLRALIVWLTAVSTLQAAAPPFPETKLLSSSITGVAVSADGNTVVAGVGMRNNDAFVWRRMPGGPWPTQPIVISGAPGEGISSGPPAIDGDDIFFTGGIVYRISGGTAARVQTINPGHSSSGDSLGVLISVIQPGEIALSSGDDFPPPRLYQSVNGQWQLLPAAQQLPACSSPHGPFSLFVGPVQKVGPVLARIERDPPSYLPSFADVWFPRGNEWGCAVLPLGLPADYPKSGACGFSHNISETVYMTYLPDSNQYIFGANIYDANLSLIGPLTLPASFALPVTKLASAGNQLALGLPSNFSPGAVQLFYTVGATLVSGVTFSASDGFGGGEFNYFADQFGDFVSMAGDTLVVGSSACTSSGSLYAYDLSPHAVSGPFDSATQGNWKGKYGQDGHIIPNDSKNLPPYAAVNFIGAASHTWVASSTDPTTLIKGGSTTDRIGSAFYATNGFTIDVNLTDGQFHQVALYCLDLDTTTRKETISILDAYTNKVLDTRAVSNFHNGVYAVWNLQGHVLIRVDNNGGLNAAVSGLFFRTFTSPAPTVTITSPLPGNVSGTVAVNANASSAAGIATIQLLSNGSNLFGPLHADPGPGGIFGVGYNWPTASVANGTYTLTAVAFDSQGQSATSPGVTVTIDNPPPVTTATFIRTDTTTQGSWKGHYGSDGEIIASDSNNPGAYCVINLTAAKLYTWSTTQDPRALQQATSATSRIASTFYLDPGFDIDLNLFDARPHQVALYFLDWDNAGRAQTVSILDANTKTPLDAARGVSNFQNGQYLVWNVQGHVIVHFSRTTGPNAVFSGLFLAPPAP